MDLRRDRMLLPPDVAVGSQVGVGAWGMVIEDAKLSPDAASSRALPADSTFIL